MTDGTGARRRGAGGGPSPGERSVGGWWRRVKEVFGAASDLPPAERGPLLDRECGSDDSLRTEVESLLAADGAAGGLVEDIVAGAACELAVGGAARPAGPARRSGRDTGGS